MTQGIGNHNQTGTLTPAHPSLSGMPDEIMRELILFNPDSVPVLRAVSRALRQNTEDFLQQNTEGIASWCSTANSPLAGLLSRELAVIRGRGQSQPDRIHILFHMSLPRTIRSLDVALTDCPNRILLSHEMDQFVSRIENVNLERVWGPIRRGIAEVNPFFAWAAPAVNATAQEIRTWMQKEANQPTLQRITQLDLRHLHLTCVPEEIGQCTGVQKLDLSENQLSSLPEGLFQGLTALRELDLSKNQLSSLPGGLFLGLTALQDLTLENNQLRALPPEIGRLVALEHIGLFSNQLEALPPEIGRLVALEQVDFSYNRLRALPPEIGQLGALFRLDLTSNHLQALPPEIGQLRALLGLFLADNPLQALPPELARIGNRPALSRLYAMSSELNPDRAAILTLLAQIFQGDRINTLYGQVWMEAGRFETEDPHWGEHHLFDDPDLFKRALIRFVREKLEGYNEGRRAHYYLTIRRLAGGPVDSDPRWGENHAFDDSYRSLAAFDIINNDRIFWR